MSLRAKNDHPSWRKNKDHVSFALQKALKVSLNLVLETFKADFIKGNVMDIPEILFLKCSLTGPEYDSITITHVLLSLQARLMNLVG